MKHSLSRTAIALGIAMSLWLTSVAAVAAPRRTQDQKPSSSQQRTRQPEAAARYYADRPHQAAVDRRRSNDDWQTEHQ